MSFTITIGVVGIPASPFFRPDSINAKKLGPMARYVTHYCHIQFSLCHCMYCFYTAAVIVNCQ